MIKTLDRKMIIKSLLGFIAAFFLLFSHIYSIPLVDKSTHEYFTKAIEKAGIAYATCRVVNASVSVVKESNLQLEPAGVGMSLAIGQVLGPVYDMVEKLSNILILAITSLGVQKLIYEISLHMTPQIIGVLLLIISTLMWFDSNKIKRFQAFLLQLSIIVLIFRMCLPISSIANDFIYKNYFEDQISQARQNLDLETARVDKMHNISFPESDGIFSTIKNSSTYVSEKTTEFKTIFVNTINNAGNIIENLLSLSFLYLGIFVIQVLFLPLLSFWLMLKSMRILNPWHY
ncbi:MAG: hypothetical protein R3331_06195 [Sulfurospirillaceae bacterium]|nr:hypothetical protein [Sulfurospirillaceae bacterium]